MKHTILLACCAIGSSYCQTSPFTSNARIGFVGDSLTSQGGYHQNIALYFATRFPTQKITFCNFGISGDRSAGCAARYEWDIKPFKGTLYTITTGVNDVNRGLYTGNTPDAKNLEQRQQAIDTHIKGTEDFIKKAQADGAKVIVISPALFDQTAEMKADKQTGINDSLRIMADADKKTAAKYGCQYIDINTPMMELNAAGQAKDPTFTIVGQDRIHPQAPGHLIMSYIIMKALNLSPTVASVSLDVKDKGIKVLDNCRITHLKLSGSEVSFTYHANALPFPYEMKQRPALELVPFNESFNNETIKIQNLDKGKYEILIDDTHVQTVTNEQLAQGVNLADNNRTPQHKQAMAVRDVLLKRAAIRGQLKTHSLLKQQFFADKPPMTWEEEKVILDEVYAKLGKANVWNAFRSGCIEQYMKVGPKRDKLQAQYEELSKQVYSINKPVDHVIVIRKK